ncbi:4-hydroxyphenylacetate 3-hydroxylase family protein [Streptomyces prasinopilosus]|uniref:4-hydroxyphenylacetate 3-monooxygenase/anthranilate 3-monooxygenase (FAD) / 4-hydroxyphenylacetate 3-monooxygenase n=1 Tax=Streptomyces prasinopilosus TaxID=67344 RepID=A0A1G6LTV8_9ACTN|nr:4-hydroxyphenylacetate 3-hydroxylase N-terminal domain-containing protein [Streptomyces prasinopilosus]SDC46680.1 4-hydroxyphenylacetate 3-monooxygenase/anthranilate 3-monooxygenase (FAD) / 4-hydroxyphenylacetate 3-monooxygenase [Streptomyces prasinopilosus]
MGLRSGAAYLEGLRDGRSLYINGERVDDVTAHPAFQGVLATLAGLYDAQRDPEFADVLTVRDEASGETHSTTLLEARTHEDVLARLRCDRLRTELTYGMMGRLPDFMNAYLLDVASSLAHVGKHEEAARMGAYLARLRREDLAVTHTLVDPQSDRSTRDAPPEAVRIVERRADGIVIRGARLLSTLAPVADEVFVGPYVPRRPGQEDYALVCTLPLDAPGLKIVCRQAYDRGDGLFDTPLSGRFDEGDAILVFDDVFVPEDRVVVAGDLDAYNNVVRNAVGYGPLQGAARSTSKLKFLAGLATVAARTTGRAASPRYQEELGEVMGLLNVAEGLLDGAAVDLGRRIGERRDPGSAPCGPGCPTEESRVGIAALTFFFPHAIARAVEVLRLVTGSGAIAMTEGELRHPEIGHLVEEYVHGPGVGAERRLQVMRMVWDMTCSPFAARQALYERYYTGDPVVGRVLFFNAPKTREAEALAERLLSAAPGDPARVVPARPADRNA